MVFKIDEVLLFFAAMIAAIQISTKRVAQEKTRVIDEIATACDLVSHGNLNTELTISSHDEFQIIAQAYNTMLENVRKSMEKSVKLGRDTAVAQIRQMESQFNPHFLFNTLNNIYSLIAFSPEKAQEAVHDLSRLLRYVLYESSQPFVPLEKDFDFLRNYVELMRIRLPKHVELKTNIVASSPGTLIAPLLFISLVENAFKHGVSNNKPSFIHLDIHQEGAEVVCTIVNSYFPKSPDQDKSGSGIGLVNLEKRLGLLYPGHFSFQCGREGDNYSSYLSITINETEI